MRTRAMDNQLCLVVARNEAHGSCIIDRKGDILAWNEGDRPFIQATVALDDGYRAWNGGCLRDIQWRQRRPYLYQALVDSGALLDQPDTHLLIPLQEEAIDAQSLQHSLHHR